MNNKIDRLRAALADRYTIERELGAGGMATVYLAEDLKHHRNVAVKVLRPELAATLGPERFVREIEIAAQLTHPHILMLIDSGEADGFLYYVMPYIEGESLRERLDRQGKLSVEDTIRLTDQVASALNYAHEQGVVHRDVKPENILLAGDQAIVADFGIARAVQVAGGERLTGTGLAIGTPAYMSPEQALGQENVDGRSDVYALGCVIYETVSGRTPFEGSTPQALLAKHAARTVPGLRASDAAIPVFVERAVERALAKSPADRFQSASAFAEALTTGSVVARVGGRHWRRRTVAGAAAVIVLLAALVGWLTTLGGPAIERLAVLPLTNLIDDPEQENFVEIIHTALIDELQLAGASVIAYRSVMQYKDSEQPVRDIARALDVDALIDASVTQTGDSLGLEVRLFDGATEEQLWNQSHRGTPQNVVGEATRAIVSEMQLALTPGVEARLSQRATVDPKVYEMLLHGRFYMYRFTPQDLQTGLQYFESVLALDPDNAAAHAGQANIWASMMIMGMVEPRQVEPRLRTAVTEALAVDSALPEAQLALALLKQAYDWEWEVSDAAYRRAIELNPSYAEARAFYSHLLTTLGRLAEAAQQIERAIELDPHNSFFQGVYGIQLQLAGRYDDAVVQLRRTVSMAPDFPLPHWALWHIHSMLGRTQEAIGAARAFFAGIRDQQMLEVLDQGYQTAGYAEAMLRAAELLVARSRETWVKPLHIASLYDKAGHVDRAVEWLDHAYEAREADMPYIGVRLYSDSLRAHPRFRALLQRLGLPLGRAQ